MDQDRLVRTATFQDGLVTRVQALAAGMSPRQVTYAIRADGPWQPVLRGVYATFTGPLGELHRLRAAQLYAGPESRVSGAWACWMNGLTYGPPCGDLVMVVVPYQCRRGSTGFVVVVRSSREYDLGHYWVDTNVAEDDARKLAVMAYGAGDEILTGPRPNTIPMVSVQRAVIDTITRPRWMPADWRTACPGGGRCGLCWKGVKHHERALRNVRALMCEAVQRERCTVEQLEAELNATSRNGTALARGVLADLRAGCRSAPECELRDLTTQSAVLPEGRWNKALPGVRGIYPDACWPEARLVVEVDSRAFHGFGDAPERTERRRARYAELGWTVLPVSPHRLRTEPKRVLAEIESAYLAGVARRRR